MKNAILIALIMSTGIVLSACALPPLRLEAETEAPQPPAFSPAIVIPAGELPAHSVSGEILIAEGAAPRTLNLVRDAQTGGWRAPLSQSDLDSLMPGAHDRTLHATARIRLINSKGFTDYYWRDLAITFRAPGLAAAQSK